jgi:hypothetical protein
LEPGPFRLRLNQNEAALCGSGSATSLTGLPNLYSREKIRQKIFLCNYSFHCFLFKRVEKFVVCVESLVKHTIPKDSDNFVFNKLMPLGAKFFFGHLITSTRPLLLITKYSNLLKQYRKKYRNVGCRKNLETNTAVYSNFNV